VACCGYRSWSSQFCMCLPQASTGAKWHHRAKCMKGASFGWDASGCGRLSHVSAAMQHKRICIHV
jgi:hypothetical protein